MAGACVAWWSSQDPGAGDLAKQNLQRRVAALPSPALGSSPAVGGGVPGRAAAGAGGGGGGAGGKGMTEDEELALAIAMSMEQGAAGGRGGGAAASGRREQSAGRNGMQSGALGTCGALFCRAVRAGRASAVCV